MTKSDLIRRRAMTEAWLTLYRIHRMMDRREEQLLAEVALDVTPAQSNVLMLLFNAREPRSARAIARELGLAEPTVGRFIRALEEGGWVERARNPSDQREILVGPTQKAKDALPRFIQVANTLLDAAFRDFSDQELAGIGAAIEKVRRNVEG